MANSIMACKEGSLSYDTNGAVLVNKGDIKDPNWKPLE